MVPDGSHDALPGKVVAISVAPASSSTTSTLYRVTIGLTDPNAKLDNGATGSVSIVTKDARAALAVPTSAVITTGNRHVVTVMEGGTATPVAVQVGVVGNTWTEITHGISRGQQVVLADASAALPSSATVSAGSTAGTGRLGGTGGRLGAASVAAASAGAAAASGAGGAVTRRMTETMTNEQRQGAPGCPSNPVA